MKLKNTSIGLIAIGVVTLIYALLIMEISVGGRIVNLDLLNTRQNLVILGALGILVGTILLAASILAKGEVPEKPRKAPVSPQERRRQILKVISIASFGAPLIGPYFLYHFFFDLREETSMSQLYLIIALFSAPFLLKKYR